MQSHPRYCKHRTTKYIHVHPILDTEHIQNTARWIALLEISMTRVFTVYGKEST